MKSKYKLIREKLRGARGYGKKLSAVFFSVLMIITSMAYIYAYLWTEGGVVTNVFGAAPKFTLHYDANADGEDIEVPSDQVIYGKGTIEVAPESNNPVRHGYDFTGWNTAPDGSGTSYEPGSEYEVQGIIDNTVTLYAQWQSRYAFNLVYDSNTDKGVFGIPESESYKDTESNTHTFTVSSLTPRRTDTEDYFIFVGWNTKPDGSGDSYDKNSVLEMVMPEGQTDLTVTLYAQWMEGFVVTYDANGGTGAPAADVYIGTEDSHKFDISETVPSMEGKVFLGWARSANAIDPEFGYLEGILGDDENEIALKSDITLTRPENHITLYAVYGFEYSLSFDNNADNLPGVSGEVPDTITRYSTRDSVKFKIPEGPLPKREGCYWGYWSENIFHPTDGTEELQIQPGENNVYIVYKENPHRTLYARYQPPEASTLSFSSNGVTAAGIPSTIAVSTTDWVWKRTLPTNVPYQSNVSIELERRKFLGWAEKADATEPDYQPGGNFEMNREFEWDKTLYAVWEPLHTYQVQFYQGDTLKTTWSYPRTMSIKEFEVPNNWSTTGTVNRKSISNWNPSITTPEHYVFRGWSTDPEATEAQYTLDYYYGGQPYLKLASGNTDISAPTIRCDGDHESSTIHVMKLYAVFEYVPYHQFRIKVNWNQSSVDGAIADTETVYSTSGSMRDLGNKEFSVKSTVSSLGGDTFGNSDNVMEDGSNYERYSERRVSSINNTYYALLGFADNPDATEPDYWYRGWYKDAKGEAMDGYSKITVEAGDDCEEGDIHEKTIYAIYAPVHGFQLKREYEFYTYSTPSSYNRIYTWDRSVVNTTISWRLMSTKEFTFTPQYSALSTNIREGYKLLGWSTDPEATEPDDGLEYDGTVTFNNYTSSTSESYTDDNGRTQYRRIDDYAYGSASKTFDALTVMSGDTESVDCQSGTIHTLTLYPIIVPENHVFQIKIGDSTNQRDPLRRKIVPIDTDSYTWEAGTKIFSSKPSYSGYALLGYSTDKDAAEPEYTLAEDGVSFNEDVKITNGKDDHCDEVDKHTITLYPVLEKQHRFCACLYYNSGGSDREYTTNTYTYSGYVSQDIKSHTWAAGELGIRSRRTGYRHIGWSTESGKLGEENVMYHIGDDVKITEDVTMTVEEESCPGGTTHYLYLYPVYELIEQHTLGVKLESSKNGNDYLGYIGYKYRNTDNGSANWSSESTTYVTFWSPYLPLTVDSYTFSGLDNGGTFMYSTASDYTYNQMEFTGVSRRYSGYNFIGWSSDSMASDPSIAPGELSPVETLDSVSDCSATHTHEMSTYYAIFEQNFGVRYYDHKTSKEVDWTGIGLRRNEEGIFDQSYTFEITETIPEYKNFVFMGWSTKQNDTFPVYGRQIDTTDELKRLTRNLEDHISVSRTSGNYYSTQNRTDGKNYVYQQLYPVWWYEHVFDYDPNGDDITSCPEMTHAYSNINDYKYQITDQEPSRVGYRFCGWSLEPDTEPGSDELYQPGDYFTVTDTDQDGRTNTKFYAVWEKVSLMGISESRKGDGSDKSADKDSDTDGKNSDEDQNQTTDQAKDVTTEGKDSDKPFDSENNDSESETGAGNGVTPADNPADDETEGESL